MSRNHRVLKVKLLTYFDFILFDIFAQIKILLHVKEGFSQKKWNFSKKCNELVSKVNLVEHPMSEGAWS